MTAPVLHSDVLHTLGSEIAGGAVDAGTVLTLAQLEERFGVSRTVVREAVRVLESLGLVRAKRRVGLTVQPDERWSVLDPQVVAWRLGGANRAAQLRSLTELRAALEPTAARLAARSGTHAGPRLLELAARLRQMGQRGEGDSAEYLAVDVAFHTLLLAAGGNEMFRALSGAVAEVLAGRTRLGLTPAHPEPSTLDDHEAVARAVADGDQAAAEAHARAVLEIVWGEVESGQI